MNNSDVVENFSAAEIAAIAWNKANDVPFSELSDALRTELELAVIEGKTEAGGEPTTPDSVPSAPKKPVKGKK